MDRIEKAAEYLMYQGPSLNELILEAEKNNFKYYVKNGVDDTILEVKSKTSYDLELLDRYWFNANNELYKQTLILRGKEKVIFDKFQEAKALLKSIKTNDSLVS